MRIRLFHCPHPPANLPSSVKRISVLAGPLLGVNIIVTLNMLFIAELLLDHFSFAKHCFIFGFNNFNFYFSALFSVPDT